MRLSRAAFLGLAAALTMLSAGPARAEIRTVQSCDTSMRFTNGSGRTVAQLFYNPTGNPNWGPDRLGQNVLRPGQSTSVRLQHARPYDFRMVWDNGQASELRNVNVCVIGEIVATNQGLRAR